MRVLLALFLLAGLAASVRADEVPTVGLTPLDPTAAEDRDPKRLQALAGLGRVLVATTPVRWGALEPTPRPSGPPAYQWKTLDDAVLLWQLAGLDPVLVLSPASSWASQPRENTPWIQAVRKLLPEAEAVAALRGLSGAGAPKAVFWGRWERFVRDVVERYDADGVKDMPGLRAPVRHVQMLGGIDPAWWLGDTAQTLRLLHHAAKGIRAAAPGCRLLAPTIDLRATGHSPFPDAREWAYRIGQITPGSGQPLARRVVTRHFALAKELLGMPQLYDILCQRGSGHIEDDVANLSFLRRTLNEGDGSTKGLWLVDNPTRKLARPQAAGVVLPKREEQRVRRRWLPAARLPTHPQHGRALDWLRRGQAYDLVRGTCRARAAGADAVLCFAPADALPAGHAARERGTGQGLLIKQGAGDSAKALERTPSWWALQQMVRRLGGQRSAVATRIGAPGQSVIFQLAKKSARPWVAVLLLDPRLSWAGTPGAALPLRDVLVTLPSGAYTLEWIRTGPREPRRLDVVSDGSITVPLGPEPVYVIPK